MARGDFLASLSVISLTALSRWSCGTTRLTMPKACICVAVHRSPSISISSRILRGRLRDRMAWIIIGQIPTLISGVPNVAVSVETKRSHEQASPRPPASACPLMRPTIGLPRPAIRVNSSTKSSRARWRSRSGMSPSKLARSAPAQNALSPAPVKTTTRTSGSFWHQRNAAARSRSMAPESGLRCSGRLSMTVATCPSIESTACSRLGISLIGRKPSQDLLECRALNHVVILGWRLSEQVGSDGDADQDEHSATNLLAPFLDAAAEPVAELEPHQRHGDAECAHRDGREDDGNLVHGKSESHRQVVDAQREGGDDEAVRLQSPRCCLLALDLPPLPDRVNAGKDQDGAGDVTGQVLSDVARDRRPKYEPDERHEGLEDSERHADADPGPGVDSAQADPDRPGKVAEADRHADEQEAEHSGHGRNYMEAPRFGILLAMLNKNTLPD